MLAFALDEIGTIIAMIVNDHRMQYIGYFGGMCSCVIGPGIMFWAKRKLRQLVKEKSYLILFNRNVYLILVCCLCGIAVNVLGIKGFAKSPVFPLDLDAKTNFILGSVVMSVGTGIAYISKGARQRVVAPVETAKSNSAKRASRKTTSFVGRASRKTTDAHNVHNPTLPTAGLR